MGMKHQVGQEKYTLPLMTTLIMHGTIIQVISQNKYYSTHCLKSLINLILAAWCLLINALN